MKVTLSKSSINFNNQKTLQERTHYSLQVNQDLIKVDTMTLVSTRMQLMTLSMFKKQRKLQKNDDF